MRRFLGILFGAAALAVGAWSCGSDGPTATGTTRVGSIGQCTGNLQSLRTLASNVFGTGSANAASVGSALERIDAHLRAGETASAQNDARLLVQTIQGKAADYPSKAADIDRLVNGILCWTGTTETSYVVHPSTQPQVLTSTDGGAGVQLPPNAVSVPTVVTITVTDEHLLTTDDTKLDRYPRSISVTSSVPIPQSVVGVCVTNVPTSVLPRLRLGHRTHDGFKIEPAAPVDFLGCTATAGVRSASRIGKLFHSLAQLVLPTTLYAKMQDDTPFASGGVGGTAGEYSPFEPVDVELFASGGVGGTAGEYIRRGPPGAASITQPGTQSVVAGGVCTSVAAPIFGALEPECRPRVIVHTANGTLLEGVPTTWTISAGGGVTAAEDPVTRACGPFGQSMQKATNANGAAGACWTLGASLGANTLTVTIGVGGDAPPGVSFNPPTQTFDATALKLTPTVGATGAAVAYDGLPHPGTGTCSDGLSPDLTYSGNGSVPVNVGTYTLTVTCGTGSTIADVATATAQITIVPAVPSLAITCPASVVYTGTAFAPCTASASAPGLNATVAVTHSANTNAGVAVASASYTGSGNYASTSASKNFTILPAPSTTVATCPATIVYSGANQNPCTATVTGIGGLSGLATVTYSPTPVRSAGAYIGSGSFGGDPNHIASAASTTFSVVPRAATATAGSATMTYGGTPPALPCTIPVLAVDAGSITCTTSIPATLVPGANVTTPVVAPSNPQNYAVTPVAGSLAVRFVQFECLISPVMSALPLPAKYRSKGTPIVIGCALRDAQGAPVTIATGNLVIEDVGTTGTATPTQVFSKANAFTRTSGASYAYTLDTSVPTFVAGHYYFVTVTWSDGSTSTGYFFLT